MKLGIIVFFVILTFAVIFDPWTLSINLSYFTYLLDIGSLVVVAVPTIAFAIGSYSWKTYVKTWSIPFGNPENNDQSELVEVNKCLNFLGNMSVMMGIIGTFIGFILILRNLQNIGDNWGPPLAIAVISFYYGFLFKALFMFASSKVEKYIE